MKNEYLDWLSKETPGNWWHDSADPDEVKKSLEVGTIGVTTNPLLVKQALYSRPDLWKSILKDMPSDLNPAQKAEEIIRRITLEIASLLKPTYLQTNGEFGYACAQVNPRFPGDVDVMLPMAKRLSKWAPNISVKLPTTAAGLDVLEECAAEGINLTSTVSYTVPQVVAIAQRYQKGVERAKKAGIKPGKCNAVIMIGRIDDYLRDVAHDNKSNVQESDLAQAGIAISKRAHSIFKENGYEATIMIAALRGTYHVTELGGAKMEFSIHPKIQEMIGKVEKPFEERIDVPVDKAVIERLQTIPDFVRAYEPDGMKAEEFITYGVVQKTLSQFIEAGWAEIEGYKY